MTSISVANEIFELARFRILGVGIRTLCIWLITYALRR